MIWGVEEFYGMMNVLEKLELGYSPAFTAEPFDYVVRYGGHESVGWNSNSNDMDEYDKPTDEELDIMCLCDDTYAGWIVDKIILEDEE